MPPTKTIARLAGPSLIAITFTEALNAPIFARIPPTTAYLDGCVLFVAGLAIVQAHNVWVRHPTVLVTILGWSAMSLGLGRMVFPSQPPKVDMDGGWPAFVGQGLLYTYGAVLSVIGYS